MTLLPAKSAAPERESGLGHLFGNCARWKQLNTLMIELKLSKGQALQNPSYSLTFAPL